LRTIRRDIARIETQLSHVRINQKAA
jgi:ribosomal protein L29